MHRRYFWRNWVQNYTNTCGFIVKIILRSWNFTNHIVIEFTTDFRDIPFHSMFEGMGGHGELVEKPEDLKPALERALSSGKTACVNVRTRSAISPIVLATTSKRDKASIE